MASDFDDFNPVLEIKQRTRDLFDDCGDHYATEREQLPYFQAQLAIMQSMLSEAQVGRILDIGCAAGSEIRTLRERGFSVVGIDFSQRMLEFGRRRFAGDAKVFFCRADAERLPVAAQSVDHMVCLGVFEFLPDYKRALRDIQRVMRPGGVAVFAIPSRISFYNLGEVMATAIGPAWRGLKRMLSGAPRPPAAPPVDRNLVVPWRFRAQLRELGFDPLRSAYTGFFFYPLDRFPRLNVRLAQVLEPLASVPLLRWGTSVYMVSARRR